MPVIKKGAKRSSRGTSSVDRNIVAALRREPLSTSDLAEALNLGKSSISRNCRRMEKEGTLKSTWRVVQPEVRLLYCVDEETVVFGADLANCKDQEHDIRSFPVREKEWALK